MGTISYQFDDWPLLMVFHFGVSRNFRRDKFDDGRFKFFYTRGRRSTGNPSHFVREHKTFRRILTGMSTQHKPCLVFKGFSEYNIYYDIFKLHLGIHIIIIFQPSDFSCVPINT